MASTFLCASPLCGGAFASHPAARQVGKASSASPAIRAHAAINNGRAPRSHAASASFSRSASPTWMPRKVSSSMALSAAPGVTTEVETLKDGSACETFTLDLGGPQTITQKVVRRAGTELIAVEVSREGGMGMVLEEAAEQTPDGKPAPRVTVVDSRSADRSKITESAPTSGISTVVVEVVPGSNAEAAGVKEGDKIRFFTAVFTVSDPIDILSYYGNPPKKENRRGIYVADDQPFDKTMAALASNAQPHVTEKEGVVEVAETVIIALERST